jgi:hypothetical protein
MKDSKTQIRDILVGVILAGGEKVERAVADGPEATLKALDALILELNDAADIVALVITLGASGGCGRPDCPNCGQADRGLASAMTSLNWRWSRRRRDHQPYLERESAFRRREGAAERASRSASRESPERTSTLKKPKKEKISVRLKRMWKKSGKTMSLRQFARSTDLHKEWTSNKKANR